MYTALYNLRPIAAGMIHDRDSDLSTDWLANMAEC